MFLTQGFAFSFRFYLERVRTQKCEFEDGSGKLSIKIYSYRADYPVTLAYGQPPLRTMMDDYVDSYNPIRRTLSGRVAIGIFVLAAILILIAFSTPYWLESDPRIVGSKFEKLGLWTHCFRSLPHPYDPALREFYVGCRWIFDPFTTGYSEIRGFLVPRKNDSQC